MPRSRRRYLVGAAVLVVLAWRIATVFTEGVNWDEFALLKRAADTVRTGVLQSGGRPGLAVVLLLPFVRGCEDSVEVVRQARLLWVGFSAMFLLGLYLLVSRTLAVVGGAMRSPSSDAGGDEAAADSGWCGGLATRQTALLAVGLLVLVPVFLRWSVQVRTDQPALACGVLGGLLLMLSRGRVRYAAASGLLFGLGYLFTQKLVYIAGLSLLLVMAAEVLDPLRRPDLRRIALRLLIVGASFGACYLAYRAAVRTLLDPGRGAFSLDQGLNVFAFYRKVLGFRVYKAMIPTLVPQLVGLGCLGLSGIWWLTSRRRGAWRMMAVAWAVVAMGLVVGLVHAAAFPYFWMTLGVFVAVSAALGFCAVLIPAPPRIRRLVLYGCWMVLVASNLPAALELLEDTQKVQRESVAFVARNYTPADRGFHCEGALFCRVDPEPFPTYFTQSIVAQFARARQPLANLRALAAQFRAKPVRFILSSYRMGQFPPAMVHFWKDRYIHYAHAVLVPGVQMAGAKGHQLLFDAVAAGEYRWTGLRGQPAPLIIDGQPIAAGQKVALQSGRHRLELTGDTKLGLFVYALPEPLKLTRKARLFYSKAMLDEFNGIVR